MDENKIKKQKNKKRDTGKVPSNEMYAKICCDQMVIKGSPKGRRLLVLSFCIHTK